MSTEIVKFTASDGIILDGILNKCEEKNIFEFVQDLRKSC